VPLRGKPGGTPVDVYDFARNKRLLMLNSPVEYVTRVPITVSVPQFFLAAGAADQGDMQAAQLFKQELVLRDAGVPLVVIPGGGHQATVWRTSLTPMFNWMTPQLAADVQREITQAARPPKHHKADKHHKAVKHRKAVKHHPVVKSNITRF
jgi:hypothetical protein